MPPLTNNYEEISSSDYSDADYLREANLDYGESDDDTLSDYQQL